ncbi:hypothetical protein L2E82_15730 [Cichorium intybus]|uniref:Uncharacterized protein n=1 Tax=Cichorium intybus TaxID=13427 RepID=A0ACB9F462_CICIN|nr:hypothetical protein L2E82_15730 [Cichorium intybus]
MIEIRKYHSIDSEIRISSGAGGVKKPHRYRLEQLQCENHKVPEHRERVREIAPWISPGIVEGNCTMDDRILICRDIYTYNNPNPKLSCNASIATYRLLLPLAHITPPYVLCQASSPSPDSIRGHLR